MTVIATYGDPNTDPLSEVRLYIDDRDLTAADDSLPMEKRSVIFSDPEINNFLRRFTDPMLAASVALRTIANNKSLLVMRRQVGDTTVDYGALRADLLKQADSLQSLFEERLGGYETPADGFAEVAYNDFGLRSIVTERVLRNGQ
jgi:hypothetical protein